MADTAIFGLGQETALTASHRLVVQETSAATLSQSATFALMGGLEHNAQTVTTADITGAVGQFYYCTIAGMTASRNLTLPASPNVGERIGVYIVDGDASFELILKGAATVTINGGSAATEWSRLFIADECVIFRATSSTNWVVEHDGRIPCNARYVLDSDITTSTAGADTQVTGMTQDFDVGDIAASDTMTARRAGKWLISVVAAPANGVTDQDYYACIVYKDGSKYCDYQLRQSVSSSSNRFFTGGSFVESVADGSYYDLYFASETTNAGAIGILERTCISVTEVL